MMVRRDPDPPRALHIVPDGRYANWEAVYQDNATWVYRTIFARVGNRADAEDLTAEVFLAALRPLKITATVAEVRAYLRATARTVLAAHWRATLGREITSIDDLEDVAPDSEEAISTAPERVRGGAVHLAGSVQPNPGTQVLTGSFGAGVGHRDGCERGERQGPSASRPTLGSTGQRGG